MLVVSCHYSKRYTNADCFIKHHCHNEEIKSHILYLTNKNITQIIDNFISSYLTQDTEHKIDEHTMFYLWKDYLISHSLPFFVNKDNFKRLLKNKIEYNPSCFLNINSTHLSYITPFQTFWKLYIYNNTESDFEVNELCSLFKDKFLGISDDKNALSYQTFPLKIYYSRRQIYLEYRMYLVE